MRKLLRPPQRPLRHRPLTHSAACLARWPREVAREATPRPQGFLALWRSKRKAVATLLQWPLPHKLRPLLHPWLRLRWLPTQALLPPKLKPAKIT